MSARVAVEIVGLSKRYRLGRDEDRRYRTLRDAVARAFTRTGRAMTSEPTEEIWALRDVSLQVGEGEALGIVGRNGAGKSTLLKLLARITEPSAGRARVLGRVSSLLELGTGFHPELTGRENVYMSGAILGMTRSEITRSFDAIVAFAGVETFLDTPVKRYSSGMALRLGFAVAAHLTAEVLLVDEVLAVGDHEFQQRCLGRMQALARGGRTVLFVSHNLWALEDLCPRTLLLEQGRVAALGPTGQVLARYLSDSTPAGSGDGAWDLAGDLPREGTGRARLTRIELLDAAGRGRMPVVPFGTPFRLRLHYRCFGRVAAPTFGVALLTERDQRVFLTHTLEEGLVIPAIDGEGAYDCLVRSPNLLPGRYFIEAWITDVFGVSACDHLRRVGQVEIVVGQHGGRVAGLTYHDRGRVYLSCEWTAAPAGPPHAASRAMGRVGGGEA